MKNRRRFQLPRSSKRTEREEVAAVCYRITQGLEFLLVRTRSGRWIFPKGGAEPGLTRAQSAEMEAFEEAGVRGRIEEAHFARYVAPKENERQIRSRNKLKVKTYLLEVTWVGSPQEQWRKPTWLSPEETRKRLRKNRRREFAAELIRIVDRACTRLQRIRSETFATNDPLRKCNFDFQSTLSTRFGISRGQEIARSRATVRTITAELIPPTRLRMLP